MGKATLQYLDKRDEQGVMLRYSAHELAFDVSSKALDFIRSNDIYSVLVSKVPQKYIDLYRLHYSVIFDSVNTDELSILNKEIINQIGNLILKDINSPQIQNIPVKIENNNKKPIQINIKKQKY